ncbi:MAG: type II toxin-antitoxin system RelE/ParE family toxin [Bifidobacteriaceae bacterium]|jgi:plasmid stabilization system protein ParE|nr:type II toxin-antitoxin system RelE/ParE family toxin [Bifidobacteriaceae bacterium]
MTFDVVIRPAAGPDVYEARDYYAGISLDLADRFEDDFHATADSLAEFPKRHREVYRDVRRVAGVSQVRVVRVFQLVAGLALDRYYPRL